MDTCPTDGLRQEELESSSTSDISSSVIIIGHSGSGLLRHETIEAISRNGKTIVYVCNDESDLFLDDVRDVFDTDEFLELVRMERPVMTEAAFYYDEDIRVVSPKDLPLPIAATPLAALCPSSDHIRHKFAKL